MRSICSSNTTLDALTNSKEQKSPGRSGWSSRTGSAAINTQHQAETVQSIGFLAVDPRPLPCPAVPRTLARLQTTRNMSELTYISIYNYVTWLWLLRHRRNHFRATT